MLTQERGNYVVWNFRNGAGTTDPPWMVRKLEKMMKTCMWPLEVQRPCWITCAQTRVLHCFKNIGWRQIRFNKQPFRLIHATSSPNLEGISMAAVTSIRNVFQRQPYGYHRNEGLDERAERFQISNVCLRHE